MTTDHDRLAHLIAKLDADTLAHLAGIARDRQRAHFRDPAAAAEELAGFVASGTRPALGWFRRHLAPRPVPPRAESAPAVYQRVLEDHLRAGYPETGARDAVRQIAAEDGLEPELIAELLSEVA